MTKHPEWLKKNDGANDSLRAFIDQHGIEIHSFRDRSVEEGDFFPTNEKMKGLEWSHFSAKKDSYFYSSVLEVALRIHGQSHVFIDLCCGSGIPFISACSRAGFSPRQAVFYDVDPEAVEIAEKNLNAAKSILQARASVKSVEDFIAESQIASPNQIICVNPPYIPYPLEDVPKAFRSVAAGRDGLKVTVPFLDAVYGTGSRLLLEWSSLSDVQTILRKVNDDFEVEFATACEMPFGKYTNSEEIYPYLEQLRDERKISFESGASGNSQILFGVILRPKNGHSPF